MNMPPLPEGRGTICDGGGIYDVPQTHKARRGRCLLTSRKHTIYVGDGALDVPQGRANKVRPYKQNPSPPLCRGRWHTNV